MHVSNLQFALCNSLLRSESHFDLDLSIRNANGITADLDTRVICPGAVAKPETPPMPWTGHNPVLEIASTQGITHVGAGIIDGEIPASLTKNGNEFVPYPDHAPFALSEFAHSAHRMKFSHRLSFMPHTGRNHSPVPSYSKGAKE
jgi:hypothetical protein